MRMATRMRSWLAGRRARDLKRQVEGLPSPEPGRPLIVVFANAAYLDVVLNWIEAVRRLGITHYVIASLDRQIHEHLTRRGIPTILAESGRALRDVWTLRIQVFHHLIEAGVDFIHSDADAVWLRNPIPEYFGPGETADLVASQGTRWPPDAFDRWGFVLCCGLFYMRSTRANLRLLETLRRHVKRTGDDQESLNRVLVGKGIEWDFPSERHIPFKQWRIRASDGVIRSHGADIQVGVLPFRRFPRIAEHGAEPCVVHPLSKKTGADKRTELGAWGLWFLPPDSAPGPQPAARAA